MNEYIERLKNIADRLIPENKANLLAYAQVAFNAEEAMRRQYGLLPESGQAQPAQSGKPA